MEVRGVYIAVDNALRVDIGEAFNRLAKYPPRFLRILRIKEDDLYLFDSIDWSQTNKTYVKEDILINGMAESALAIVHLDVEELWWFGSGLQVGHLYLGHVAP